MRINKGTVLSLILGFAIVTVIVLPFIDFDSVQYTRLSNDDTIVASMVFGDEQEWLSFLPNPEHHEFVIARHAPNHYELVAPELGLKIHFGVSAQLVSTDGGKAAEQEFLSMAEKSRIWFEDKTDGLESLKTERNAFGQLVASYQLRDRESGIWEKRYVKLFEQRALFLTVRHERSIPEEVQLAQLERFHGAMLQLRFERVVKER